METERSVGLFHLLLLQILCVVAEPNVWMHLMGRVRLMADPSVLLLHPALRVQLGRS